MKLAERMLAAYADAAPWEEASIAGRSEYELEEPLIAANKAFEIVCSIDAGWQGSVAAGQASYREEEKERIADLYRQWLRHARRHLSALRRQAHDLESTHARELALHIEEAESLLASFDLEAEMLPVEAILPAAQGNPRPERYGR